MSQLYLDQLLCDIESIDDDFKGIVNYLKRVRKESLTKSEYNELIADAAEKVHMEPRTLNKIVNTLGFIENNIPATVTPSEADIGKAGLMPYNLRVNGKMLTLADRI